MTTQLPGDLYLKALCDCAWLENNEITEYLAGARTAINFAELLVGHGVFFAYHETWQYLIYASYHQLTLDQLVDSMRKHFEDGALWLTFSIFDRPDLRRSKPHIAAVRHFGWAIMEVYRYLSENHEEAMLVPVWQDYLVNLRSGLDRIETRMK